MANNTSYTITGNRTPPKSISNMRRAVWEENKHDFRSYQHFENVFVLLMVHGAIREGMNLEEINDVMIDYNMSWGVYPGDAYDFKDSPPPYFAYYLDREALQIHSLKMYLGEEG